MKYVIKGGGSVLTKKGKPIPEEWDTKKTLDYLIRNKDRLIEWENVNHTVEACTDLVRKGHTVYCILGGGVFAHPLAKKAGFPGLSADSMAMINYSMHMFTSEVVDVCYEQKVNVVPLYYASFVREKGLPEYIRDKGKLYVMSSFVSDRPQIRQVYEPIGSDDIFVALATRLESDYNIMISKKILRDEETGRPLEDGSYTPSDFMDNVKITENGEDVTGGLARKMELAFELVNGGHELYVMTPEKFPEFVQGKEVGIKLVKG